MNRKIKSRLKWSLLIFLFCWIVMAQSCMKFRISDSKAKEEFAQKGLQASFNYTDADETGLHYVKTGADTLPTIFFVHGSPGSWDAFKIYLMDTALLQHFRLISVDRPGFGYSSFGTAFNLEENEVKELMPGNALIVKAGGDYTIEQIVPAKERKACSFERIYFSRGSDEKIYRERIALGYNLSATVLKAVDYDLKNTIFSFIPNTAETAFYGLIKGAEDYLNKIKIERIMSWEKAFDEEKLSEMVNRKIRIEKIAIKDVKLRTFITEDSSRNEMVQHVYDITYGTVRKDIDTLVVIDDSIVRGTTLRESIIRMLSRLKPKRIIVVSSAPQIRYPDCYGIDMSKMGDFIAFKAAIELIKESGRETLLDEILSKCKELQHNNQLHTENLVRQVYKPFSLDEISTKIAQLIKPDDINIPVDVIYQKIETLHEACPGNKGDWYFTGNYPTPGGNKVCNKAFMNFMEGKNVRGY